MEACYHLWRLMGGIGRPANSGVFWQRPVKLDVWQCSWGADTSSAAGLMLFYSPVQLSSLNGQHPGISAITSERLCWEKWQNFFRPHVWMFNPGQPLDPAGYWYRLTLLGVTLAEHKSRVKSVRKDEKKATVYSHHVHNHPLFEGCLAFASPLPLLSLSLALNLKLIHDDVCSLNGPIHIPQV